MPSFNYLGGPFLRSLNHPGSDVGSSAGIDEPFQGGGVGRPLFPFRRPPLSTRQFAISGTTRDGTGAALAGCHVELYSDLTDQFIADTTSDGAGNFSFTVPGNGDSYFLVAFDAGNTVTGATIQGLRATAV